MDKIFANGITYKEPSEKSPKFVKGRLSFKLTGENGFAEFAKKYNDKGWLNLDILESKNGKIYIVLNTWKPDRTGKVNQELQRGF